MSGLVLKIGDPEIFTEGLSGDPAPSVFRSLNRPEMTPEPCLVIRLAEQAGTWYCGSGVKDAIKGLSFLGSSGVCV